jgi:hypothetical protein
MNLSSSVTGNTAHTCQAVQDMPSATNTGSVAFVAGQTGFTLDPRRFSQSLRAAKGEKEDEQTQTCRSRKRQNPPATVQ